MVAVASGRQSSAAAAMADGGRCAGALVLGFYSQPGTVMRKGTSPRGFGCRSPAVRRGRRAGAGKDDAARGRGRAGAAWNGTTRGEGRRKPVGGGGLKQTAVYLAGRGPSMSVPGGTGVGRADTERRSARPERREQGKYQF